MAEQRDNLERVGWANNAVVGFNGAALMDASLECFNRVASQALPR
jgi:hypothetical protein